MIRHEEHAEVVLVTVVGIDTHKNTHTLVAVDGLGRRLQELTVEARPSGHEKVLA